MIKCAGNVRFDQNQEEKKMLQVEQELMELSHCTTTEWQRNDIKPNVYPVTRYTSI